MLILLTGGSANGKSHFFRNLSQKRICDHNSDGANDHVRSAAGSHHGIFTRCGFFCPCLYHRSGGICICAHCCNIRIGIFFINCFYYTAAELTALTVYNKNIHLRSPYFRIS